MKFLLLGSEGQIGGELKKILKKKKIKFFFFNKKQLNLINIKKIKQKIIDIKPDVIINAAAYTNVNLSSKKKQLALKINYNSVKEICKISKRIGSLFFHYSTDYVFDGKKKSYSENDEERPLNYYGKTKLLADNYIRKNMKKYLIARVSWVYSEKPNNFVMKVIKQFVSKNKKVINVVDDEFGTPNSSKFIAKISIKLLQFALKKKIFGLYNISNKGMVSRYDLAFFLKNKINIDNKILKKISTNKNKIKRPKFSNLRVKKIEKLLKIKLPHWKNDLNNFFQKLNYANI